MSDSGATVPKDLADTPSNPFQPTLPPSRSFRRPIVRRPTAQPSTAPSFPTRTSKPFGEIDKEDETDNFDVLSLVSGVSGLSTAEDVDEETVAFMPRVRDLRYRRPVVRKKTLDVKKPEQAGEEKEVVEPVQEASEAVVAKPNAEMEKKDSAYSEEKAASSPVNKEAAELAQDHPATTQHVELDQQDQQKQERK
ncbi:hypothetical protein NBRC10512_004598 [Rhodotorula toruloides]|uniref:RHTO0S10e02916g1_1 n=2 Tax=Rhodotorula toruloides TaxID=5286 RepID=A0A061B5X9_RHOTO|nr:uncharacterized protein RHTO_05394 [Rhodotorula toruloides NP11]EMS19022.1 hypothetical protein RHTO_05394 [Rhodotorula toruloides NP11]CDR44904.1 RHTO0S10e02916g1_1 [Rhodotorula toruloides]